MNGLACVGFLEYQITPLSSLRVFRGDGISFFGVFTLPSLRLFSWSHLSGIAGEPNRNVRNVLLSLKSYES